MLRHAVQDGRRFVHIEEVAGKHVAAEQQVVARAEKSAVPPRVARQMNHPQAAPEGKFLVVGQELINPGGPIAEQKSPAASSRPHHRLTP